MTPSKAGYSTLVGVDGCRGGWLAVSEEGGAEPAAQIFSQFADLCDAFGPQALVAVDIPIGLPARGPRLCDQEARKLLGRPRASSVFPAPIRACIAAADYPVANNLHRVADGRGLTKQAFAILPKIREVDEALRDRTKACPEIIEVHPEVCFGAWAGIPMKHPKRRGAGFYERASLIEARWPGALAAQRKSLVGQYAKDDLADAFAALWTAHRYAACRALSFPLDDAFDEVGLPMRILA
jgi:predicted RNase H-like nuclease